MLYRLTDIVPLSHDVNRLTLTPLSGGVADFMPGQYLEIVLSETVRCAYSIACAPRADGSLELHVRATPQSDNYLQLEAQLVQGAVLEIALPFGDVIQDARASGPLLLLAGSTGFSQAKALIEQWLALGCPRPLHVYWGGRLPRDLYLNEWMLSLAREHPALHYVPVVSEHADDWSGRTGFVHKAVLEDVKNFTAFTVIGCGSPPMVYAACDDFIAAGMQASQLLSDVFNYAPR